MHGVMHVWACLICCVRDRIIIMYFDIPTNQMIACFQTS